MAAIALQQTRPALITLQRSWKTACTVVASFPAFGSWQNPLRSLLELLPPIVLAVPKKKVSHSRKAMRSAHKGLQDKQNIVHCPGCGEPKLAHHACRSCYDNIISQLRREAKKENRG